MYKTLGGVILHNDDFDFESKISRRTVLKNQRF
nr:MAG TPA: hypothetical protein [Caudoviricetes sp.]